MNIFPYDASLRGAVLDLSLRAWESVFSQMPESVPPFVFANFYPDGWRARQLQDLGDILDREPGSVHVALAPRAGADARGEDGTTADVAGWVCVRIHPEDSMGEICVLAVDPGHQRRGVASALMEHAYALIREAGMTMVMVETGDDPGHAPARNTYEAAGFERWPVARYFKDLTADRSLD